MPPPRAGSLLQPLLRSAVHVVHGRDFDQHLGRQMGHAIQQFEAADGRKKRGSAARVRLPAAAGLQTDRRKKAVQRLVNGRRAGRMHEGDSFDHSLLNLPSGGCTDEGEARQLLPRSR